MISVRRRRGDVRVRAAVGARACREERGARCGRDDRDLSLSRARTQERKRRRHDRSKVARRDLDRRDLRAHVAAEAFEIGEQLVGVLVALLRVERDRALDDGLEASRDGVAAARLERRDGVVNLLADELDAALVAEWMNARDRAKEQCADGVDVDRCVRVLAIEDLLGRHVLERSDDAVGRRELDLPEHHVDRTVGFFVLDEPAHAEIDEHGAPVTIGGLSQDHVAGLHVAVDDVRSMHGLQAAQDVDRNIDGFVDRDALAMHDVREGRSFEKLHHEHGPVFPAFDPVDHAHDVLGVDAREQERFARKTHHHLATLERFFAQHLDGDARAELDVHALPHFAHCAARDAAGRAIAARDDGAAADGLNGHARSECIRRTNATAAGFQADFFAPANCNDVSAAPITRIGATIDAASPEMTTDGSEHPRRPRERHPGDHRRVLVDAEKSKRHTHADGHRSDHEHRPRLHDFTFRKSGPNVSASKRTASPTRLDAR